MRFPACFTLGRIDIPEPEIRQQAVWTQKRAIHGVQRMKRRPEFIEQETEDWWNAGGGETPHRIGHHRQIQSEIMSEPEIAIIAQASVQLGGLAVAGTKCADGLAHNVPADMQIGGAGKPSFQVLNIFVLHASPPASLL